MKNQLYIKVKFADTKPVSSGSYFTNNGNLYYNVHTDQWTSNSDAREIIPIYVYSWFKPLELDLNEIKEVVEGAVENYKVKSEPTNKMDNILIEKFKKLKHTIAMYF